MFLNVIASDYISDPLEWFYMQFKWEILVNFKREGMCCVGFMG